MKNDDRRQLFRAVFNTEQGRIVLREIQDHCHTNESVFNKDSERLTTFNQGLQEAGRWIGKQVKTENSE